MTDGHRFRVRLDLPASLVEEVGPLAQRRGDVLAGFLHAAIVTATKAAIAGHAELLPASLPRTMKSYPGPTSVLPVSMPRERAACCAAVLKGAGSSMRVVAIRALEAYRDADGEWLNAVLPGEASYGCRASVAAGAA